MLDITSMLNRTLNRILMSSWALMFNQIYYLPFQLLWVQNPPHNSFTSIPNETRLTKYLQRYWHRHDARIIGILLKATIWTQNTQILKLED